MKTGKVSAELEVSSENFNEDSMGDGPQMWWAWTTWNS